MSDGKFDDDDDNDEYYRNDEYSDDTDSFVPPVQDEDEAMRRSSSSLSNYAILPPIKATTKNSNPAQQKFIKNLQEKYQQPNNKNDIGNDAKLDDAYLKMKRLDKALEEAFEKEKQVKIETMALMKKLRSEMQTLTVALNSDPNESSHTQLNLQRFLALDDEILKLDSTTNGDENNQTTESIFKTQLSDPLGESGHTSKIDRESLQSDSKASSSTKKKKSSLSSNSTSSNRDPLKKTKIPGKDFIKRNIQLAKELGGAWALTDDEKHRINQLLNDDDQENAVALTTQPINGYSPTTNESQRLKEIDDLLESEYYNPLLNHQLRRYNDHDIDYGQLQQITNEENEQMENSFGEQTLKETRLQREHVQRLRDIDEKLENLHRPNTEEKTEAVLSEDQLSELLGQCAVDKMKEQFSFLSHNTQNNEEIDYNDLSNYAVTHYVENTQGPVITEEIIQLLLNEAQQEGIAMRTFDDENEDVDFLQQQQADPLSLAPAIDRPISSTSISSHVDLTHKHDLY